jgi:hypothetical protein
MVKMSSVTIGKNNMLSMTNVCQINATYDQLKAIGCKSLISGKYVYIVNTYPNSNEVEISIDIDHIILNNSVKTKRYMIPRRYITPLSEIK